MIQTWLYYLFEVSICLIFFYGTYWLFLKKETFHRINRAYLDLAICLSFAIPLMEISIPIYSTGKFSQPHIINPDKSSSSFTNKNVDSCLVNEEHAVDQLEANTPSKMANSDVRTFPNKRLLTGLMCVYLFGVLVLLFRFIVQLAHIAHLVRKGEIIIADDLKIVNISEDINPCCFGNKILINRTDLSEDDFARIIQHERVHIEQLHSFDNTLTQMLTIVLWFNPVTWLYRNALRLTHEYLADAAASSNYDYPSSYQTLLLRQLISSTSIDLAHGFILRPMQQRIAMMTRPRSSALSGLKVLWALPIVGMLLGVFAIQLKTIRAREVRLSSTAEDTFAIPSIDSSERVVLEGIEEIFNGILTEMEHKDYIWRSYIYMRLACMRAAGWEEIDYATLMPVSGYGLSFAYEAKKQSGAHYYRPDGTDERIARATGFGWEWLAFDDIEQCWQVLKQTIDSGRPVHAHHMEEVLFVGYQEADKKKDRKVRPLAIPVFVDPDTWWSWREFEKWFRQFGGHLGRYTGRQEMIPDKEVAIDVMKTIVELAYNDSRSKKTNTHMIKWGLAGIEAFAADMADMTMKERHFCSGWFGCHDSNPQTTARQLTGRYLAQAAGLFDEPAAALIQAAAQEYEFAHEAWLKWDQHLGRYSPYRGWRDRKHRLAGAKAALEALKHERRAVEKISEVLLHLST